MSVFASQYPGSLCGRWMRNRILNRCGLIYIQRKIFFRATIFLYSPYHYMRAWIRVLVAMNARRGQRESPHYKAQDWSEL